MTTINRTARKHINEYLYAVGRTYHAAIPLQAIFDVIAQHTGEQVIQEDGTPWSGVLCGREGRATFEISNLRQALQLSWYKLESGSYEVTAYIA